MARPASLASSRHSASLRRDGPDWDVLGLPLARLTEPAGCRQRRPAGSPHRNGQSRRRQTAGFDHDTGLRVGAGRDAEAVLDRVAVRVGHRLHKVEVNEVDTARVALRFSYVQAPRFGADQHEEHAAAAGVDPVADEPVSPSPAKLPTSPTRGAGHVPADAIESEGGRERRAVVLDCVLPARSRLAPHSVGSGLQLCRHRGMKPGRSRGLFLLHGLEQRPGLYRSSG
ncbi:hypothetical protein SAMN04489733_2460 [Amycolatopsis keratiniphila]|nr:hypothetical protein SAMN04489733_2460 [Amycolatopsis keratiniphila]